MKIHIAYATYSSGTQTASALVENILKNNSHEVLRTHIKDTTFDDLQNAEIIILASPSWWNRNTDGMPHEQFLTFMDNCIGKTLEKKFAIFGLGDEKFTHFCGAVDKLEAFVQSLRGTLLIPSLKIDGFYFNQSRNEKILSEWTDLLIHTLSPQS